MSDPVRRPKLSAKCRTASGVNVHFRAVSWLHLTLRVPSMPSLPNPSDAAHRRLWRGVGAPWLVTGPHQATPRAASGAGGAGATARQLGFARASRSEDHSWRAQALTAISKCVPRTEHGRRVHRQRHGLRGARRRAPNLERAVKSRAKPTNRPGRRSLITNPYEVLIQGVVDYAIYMLDLDGRVVSWNPGAERIKGYTEEEILGEHFSRFYTPEDRAAGAPEQALRMAVESGRFTAEAWRCRKDGSRFWAMVVIDPIYQEDTLIGFAKITRDLTERLEAQQQLEHSRELLFQAQKMEAVGQLTGGLAHDFNNLLTGITGNLELMKRRIAQGRFADIDRFMTGAQDAASRAAALTHRLLAFARRQTLDPKLINPSLLIANLRDLLQRSIGPTIELETVGVTDLGSALCDPHQLENAILNLCINARDAMPAGGRLMIETAGATLNDHDARARDMDPGQYIVIGVTDTGTGIPSDVLAHVFEPFFTTKPAGRGTGLGLSMIYGFAKQSGGQVLIDSREGVGTTVRIYLPQHSGNTDVGAQQDRPAEVPQAGSDETILIVDDEPTVRTVITEVLSELGYAAIEVSDGTSGLKVLQSDVRIDLLITDVGLSGSLNGRQMADAARLNRPKLPVLFITGYAESVAFGRGTLAPGMHLMAKPFAMEALAGRIRSIIRDGC